MSCSLDLDLIIARTTHSPFCYRNLSPSLVVVSGMPLIITVRAIIFIVILFYSLFRFIVQCAARGVSTFHNIIINNGLSSLPFSIYL